jgi:hypothetical protein
MDTASIVCYLSLVMQIRALNFVFSIIACLEQRLRYPDFHEEYSSKPSRSYDRDKEPDAKKEGTAEGYKTKQ